MATGGFGTEAAKKTDSGLKDKVGGAAYAITGEHCKVLVCSISCLTISPAHMRSTPHAMFSSYKL